MQQLLETVILELSGCFRLLCDYNIHISLYYIYLIYCVSSYNGTMLFAQLNSIDTKLSDLLNCLKL